MFMVLNSCSSLSLYLSLALKMSFFICRFMYLSVVQSCLLKASRFSLILSLMCLVIQGLEFGNVLMVFVGMIASTQNCM